MSRSQRVLGNVLSTTATQLSAWVLSFVVTLFLPKYAGSDGLGKIAVAMTLVGLLGVLASCGTSSVVIKEVARDRERSGELLAASLLIRIPLSVATALLAVAAAWAFRYPADTRLFVAILAAGMVIGTANDAITAVLQGREEFSKQNRAALIDKVLSSGATIGLICMRAPLPLIVSIPLATGLVQMLLNVMALRPALTGALPAATDFAALRGLAAAGLPFLGWAIFRSLYGQTDPLVLSAVTTPEVIGWYAVATRLVGPMMFFPYAVTSALLPALAALHAQESRVGWNRTARRLLCIVLLMGVPLCALLISLPGPLLELLHYPASFAGAVPVLRVAGASALLYFVAIALGTIVVASDRQSGMFRSSVLATVIGLPTCFLLSWITQKTMGNAAIGAMLSDAIIELLVIVAYVRLVPLGTFTRRETVLVFRYLAAGVVMAGVMLSGPGQGLGVWATIPGVLAFLVACLLFRCFDAEDISAVHGFVRGYLAGVRRLANFRTAKSVF